MTQHSDIKEVIKNRLSILDVVAPYVELQHAGKHWKGKSPFSSDRTASFFVTPEKNLFHCFSTGKGGDIFTFIQEIEGVEFKDALKILADKAGVELTPVKREVRDAYDAMYAILEDAAAWYHVRLLKTDEPKAYLKERGITESSVRAFRIGFAPDDWSALYDYLKTKGHRDEHIVSAGLAVQGKRGMIDRFRSRIMFPISDAQGRVVGFSGRIFIFSHEKMNPPEYKVNTGKYINSPDGPLYDKSQVLYGFNRAKDSLKRAGYCVVVEGQMDLVMSHQAGISHAVALSGTALSDNQLALIQRFVNTVILAFDADPAGKRATIQSALRATARGIEVRVASLPDNMDPADMIRERPEMWQSSLDAAMPYISFYVRQLSGSASDITRKLHEGLYPIIRAMPQSLARDEALGHVAFGAGRSPESVREDFLKWLQTQSDAPTAPVLSAHSTDETSRWLDVSLQDHIAGLAALIRYEGGELPIMPPWFESYQPDPSAELQIEILYGSHAPAHRQSALESLILSEEQERIRSELEDARSHLRRAEADRDHERVIHYAQQCEHLSKQLETLRITYGFTKKETHN